MAEANNQRNARTEREDSTMVLRMPAGANLVAPVEDPVHFLLLLEGDPPFKRLPLQHLPVTVGRIAPADIVLEGGTVSRRHCRFVEDGNRILVSDLGSTNGTSVNGEPLLTPTVLLDGDVVAIGAYQVRYHRRHVDADAEADAMEHEFHEAAAYVAAILPPPVTSGPVLAEWIYRPCTRLGGDAFGYQMLDDRHFAAFVLDVSGHGIGQSLYSVSVANVLRQRLLPAVDFCDPGAVIGALNRMFPMEQHNGLYFTIWYGVYDSQERLLTFSSGGHHPAYLVPTPLERPVPLGTRNPSVGFIEDRVFVSACAPIPRGGALHLFSDGVFEIVDQSGQSWNMDNLLALLPLMSDAGGPQRLYDHVRATARGGRLDDDFSAVLLRFP